MKRNFYLIAVILLGMLTKLNAQEIAIKAGFNLSNLLVKDDEDTYSDDNSLKPGFQVGATANFPINDFLSFETGVLLSTKGYKLKDKVEAFGLEAEVKEALTLYYIDIPLTAKFHIDAGDARVFALTGPYLGVGLHGKYKGEVEIGGQTEEFDEEVDWGTDEGEDFLRRLDYGVLAGAGVEFDAVLIQISYALGLANISTYQDEGATIQNRVLTFGIGYIIGR